MKILLASDGSPNALNAADFIMGLATTNEIEVHLIQVLHEESTMILDSLNPTMPIWKTTSNQDQIQQVSERHVDILAMLSESCSSVSMSNPRGDACNCILAEAELRDVDLIVMGARGHSVLERVLLGSVSEYVAHHANCSVVVVRPSKCTKERTGECSQAPKKLLVAYDCSRGAYEAVQEMLKTDWSKEAHVNVLSVAQPGLPFEEDLNSGHENSEVKKFRLAGESLAGMIGAEVTNVSNQVVQSNHAGDAIVRNAEETQSDLIVVGETGQGLLRQWILGSTTKYVLRHAPCSVWISRHHRKSEPQPVVAEHHRSSSV